MGFATTEEYIASLEGEAAKHVFAFVDFVKAEFPDTSPRISYSMPMWWAGKKIYDGYLAVSAAKAHYSIHFGDEGVIARLKEMLPGCTFSKRCVNIRYGDEDAAEVARQAVKEYMGGLPR